MTPRRAARALLAVSVTAVATVTVVPAHATEQKSIRLPGKSVVEHDYPSIFAPEPATGTIGGVVGPDECRDLPSCALVPIDVDVPETKPGDDFYITLEMSWADPECDLDTFLFDDKQTEDGEAYTQVASSASGDNPELIKAFEPKLGRYNLVVQNFACASTGWHLKAESLVGEFDKPIEQLAPSGGTNNPGNRPTTTTIPGATTTTMPTATATTVTVPEGALIPDGDFQGEAFAPDDSFQEQLASSQEAVSALRRPKPNPTSPSAVSVVLAMVGFPAILVALVFLAVRLRKGGVKRRHATTEYT